MEDEKNAAYQNAYYLEQMLSRILAPLTERLDAIIARLPPPSADVEHVAEPED